MSIYGEWDGQPHTNKHAGPSAWRIVEHVQAIRVVGGTYRGCRPIDGVFELLKEPRASRGKLKVEVKCSWHGVKPPTCFPHLIVKPGHFEIIDRFSGEVIDDLSGPTKATKLPESAKWSPEPG